MKYAAIALTGLVILAGCQGSKATETASFDEAEARSELEGLKVHTWRQLYRENDTDGLTDFLADDFVIIGADGDTTTKAEIILDLEANPWDMPEDFLYTVTGILFPTSESAIVYGYGESTREREGIACLHRYTSSNVFRNDDGRWRPVSSHVSDSSCE